MFTYFGINGLCIIYEEEQNVKSAKWTLQDKHGPLVSYDNGIIYCVYLYNKAKVIHIKDSKIFENIDEKKDSQVISYDVIMTSKY